ncbi:MAG: type II secretion system F family protein [Elusimicrobiales bacterium]|jgi:tight adherence protein C|nr:type II secretion system F family protein [Elusimicrobiales bacterium]
MDQFINLFMLALLFVGSMAAFTAVQRFLKPPETGPSSIGDISDMEGRETSVFSRLDPNRSVFERVDLFLARDLGLEKKLEETYMLLGKPASTDPLKILHAKEMAAVVLPLVMYLVSDSFMSLIFMPLGFLLPDGVVFSRRIRERQEDIIRNFPTFVDLSALMIESGLDYMTAFDRIVKISTQKTGLELEVERMINEVQLGYSRRDALRNLAMRTGLQEIRSFVGLIIQSDELGTSLVELLRNFSTDMRFRRLNKAEKLAAQASTKMLIPLFIFIFPTVFILMLSPMIADLLMGGALPF